MGHFNHNYYRPVWLSIFLIFALSGNYRTSAQSLTYSTPEAAYDINYLTLAGGFGGYTNQFGLSSEMTISEGLVFKPDGTKLFVVGGGHVYSYKLAVPFEVSTAEFVTDFDVSDQEQISTGIAFNNDGTKMYIVGREGGISDGVAVIEYNLSTAYDLTNASYAGAVEEKDVSEQATNLESIAFSSNGLKMFILSSYPNDAVYEYDLSSPYDVSDATYNDVSKNVSSEEGNPKGVAFNSDGTKMYIAGNSTASIIEYELSAGYDISNADYTGISKTYDVSGQTVNPQGIAFDADGLKMFVLEDGENIYQYELPTLTNYDVSKAAQSRLYDVSSEEPSPQDVEFNNDGTRMFIIGQTNDHVVQYELSNAFDVASAHTPVLFGLASYGETTPKGLAFNDTGSKMFIVGTELDQVLEFELNTSFDLSDVGDVSSYDFKNIDFNGVTEGAAQDVVFNSDGLKMYLVGNSNDRIYEFELSSNFNISSPIYLGFKDISSEETSPTSMAFNGDGTKMFVLGFDGDAVVEYDLSDAYDVSSAIYSGAGQEYSVLTQDAGPRGLAFNNNGSKMYMVGTIEDKVWEYNLTAAYNASMAIQNRSFDVRNEEGSPQEIEFNNDGTRMFVIGESGEHVVQYELSNAFDVSSAHTPVLFSSLQGESAPKGLAFNDTGNKMYITGTVLDQVLEYHLTTAFDLSSVVSYEHSYNFQSEVLGGVTEGTAQDVVFNSDGSKMYLVGNTHNRIYEFELSTEFNVSTVSYVDFKDVSSEETSPSSMAFNSDGTKMFVLGFNGDAVVEYNLSDAYDVSSANYSGAGQEYSVSTQDTGPRGLAFNNDGTKMYMVGMSSDIVWEYTLTGYDISNATFDNNTEQLDISPSNFAKDICFSNDGLKLFVADATDNVVYEFDLDLAFDVSSANYNSVSLDISNEENNVSGMSFDDDGDQLFIVGLGSATIYKYDLGAAFDLYNGSYSGTSLVLTGTETSPNDIIFNDDGTKLFVIGSDDDMVEEYTLTTPYDISITSASYAINEGYYHGAQEDFATGIEFNSDGMQMFLISYKGAIISVYDLDDPYDVSTAVFNSSKEALDIQNSTQDMVFNPDGTKMFVLNDELDQVLEFNFIYDYFENHDNDGSILNGNPMKITLTGDTFDDLGSGSLLSPSQFEINNVPSGLTPILTLSNGNSTATLTFSGNALAHEFEDSEYDLNIEFKDAAFTNSVAFAVSFSGSGTPFELEADIVFTLNGPLPVELTHFNAYPKNEQVHLEWATASELNNDYFEVQRSTDGLNYEVINIVPGQGTTSTTTEYAYSDTAPLPGTSYYRLRQVDFDGQFEIFDAVRIYRSSIGEGQHSILYPNPVTDGKAYVRVHSNAENQMIQMRVFDLVGQELSTSQFELSNGNHDLPIKIAEHLHGMVYVEITQSNIRTVHPLLIR